MENYLLENVIEFKPALCGNKTFLIVHKLHRTPYHIGLISGDMYFSLTVNGKETKSRSETLEDLSNKAYNNLLIEIKQDDAIAFEAEPYFENTELNHVDFVSCLHPVRSFLSAFTANNKTREANNLFELLDALQGANLTGVKMATRMNPIMEGKIVLQRYDTSDIARYIKKLKEKQ